MIASRYLGADGAFTPQSLKRWVRFMVLPVALVTCAIGFAASEAQASTTFDDFLKKAPSLFVYTDGAAKTETLNISGSWWSDFKQAYAKRQDLPGWPSNFVPEFESFMATGSWAVFMQENSDGITISMFGTSDPNAYCDFSAPSEGAPLDMFGCTSHAGYDYATAEYFTHNSYGGNGCVGFVPPYNFCSDNGMNVYSHPVIGHTAADSRFWSRFLAGSLSFYTMNFDVRYPDGYAGDLIGTKPVPHPPTEPPTTPPPDAPLDSFCPRVKLIGVRGSGERSGVGKVVGGFSTRLSKKLRKLRPNETDQFYEVPVSYEAVSAADGIGLNATTGRLVTTKYRLSVDSGVESLKSVLSNDPCMSKSQYVLAGYSQGAHAIGDVIARDLPVSSLARIRAVVLFGDSKFNPNAKEVKKYGKFDAELDGVRRGRRSGALNAVKRRVFSFCRKGDIVCQWRLSDYVAHRQKGIRQHQSYGRAEFDVAVSKVIPLLK